MSDESAASPPSEPPQKQDAITIVPIATLMVTMELFNALARENPKVARDVAERVKKLEEKKMGRDYPESLKLALIMVDMPKDDGQK